MPMVRFFVIHLRKYGYPRVEFTNHVHLFSLLLYTACHQEVKMEIQLRVQFCMDGFGVLLVSLLETILIFKHVILNNMLSIIQIKLLQIVVTTFSTIL